MIAFPEMISQAAKNAKIRVPKDLESYDARKFPHWHFYCCAQLGRAVRWGNHWNNAFIVAKIPKKDILACATYADVYGLAASHGFEP